MRIPAVLLASILVVNALFFPGATDRLVELGPLAITREGLTFGLVSAGRVLVAFLASVLFLFTTLADDLLEALVARGVSHRLAFVVLSAVQLVPRMQARAASILEAQQARGLAIDGFDRAPRPGPRPAHRPGPARLARSTSASGPSRSRLAASARDRAARPTGSSRTRPATACCAGS